MKILIADDNQPNVELLEAYISDLNAEVMVAADGIEVMEKTKSTRPDMLLLDVMMPRLSGFEVCERLRKEPATRKMPIILITALHDKADMERGIDVGADDFISKPISKPDLIHRIQALLAVQDLEPSLERTLAYQREMNRLRTLATPQKIRHKIGDALIRKTG